MPEAGGQGNRAVREWNLTSRETLLAYAAKHHIPVEYKKGKKSPYSMDANLLHISYEGGVLEDPWPSRKRTCGAGRCRREGAEQATYIELTYKRGDVVAINGKAMSPATVLATLNKVGGANGIVAPTLSRTAMSE